MKGMKGIGRSRGKIGLGREMESYIWGKKKEREEGKLVTSRERRRKTSYIRGKKKETGYTKEQKKVN